MKGRPCGPTPSETMLRRVYVQGGNSLRVTAATLGFTKAVIVRAMDKYGIERRPAVPRSRLRHYSVRELQAGIKDHGLRGYAKIIGVTAPALLYHLRQRLKTRPSSR